MWKLTKAELKDRERIAAWLAHQPFRENQRAPLVVPDLPTERVLAEYRPMYEPQGRGSFYTPPEMAESLVSLLAMPSHPAGRLTRLLEPSAGIGSLLYPLRGRWEGELAVDAVEMDLSAHKVGQKLFPWAAWYCCGLLERFPASEGYYDFVLANPPFGASVAISDGKLFTEGRASRSQTIFLEAMLRALAIGGRLATIWPYSGVMGGPFDTDEPLLSSLSKAGLDWFNRHAAIERVVGLLPGSFAWTPVRCQGYLIRRIA